MEENNNKEKHAMPAPKSKMLIFVEKRKGIIFGLMIGILCALQQLIGKNLTNRYDIAQILTIRFGIQLYLCITQLLFVKSSFRMANRNETFFVISQCVIFNIAVICLYLSFNYVPYADSIAIVYGVTTVSAIILGRLFLKEHVSCCTCILTVFVIIGIILTSQPEFLFKKLSDNKDTVTSLTGNLFSLIAGIFFGGASVIQRKAQLTSSDAIAFYLALIGLLINIITVIIQSTFKLPDSDHTLDYLLFLSTGFINFCKLNLWSRAFQIGNVAQVTLATQIDVPISYVLEFVVMSFVPDWLSILGAFEMFMCIVILTLQDQLNCGNDKSIEYEEIPSGSHEKPDFNKHCV